MPDSRATEEKVGLILLTAAMASAVVLLFWLQRGLAFADDSFNWLALSGIGSSKALIEPYGGHLIFIPMLIFKAGLGAFGTSYTGFGVIQVVLVLLLSGLLYEYGRRRVGPLLALPAAVIVLFLGSSWNVLMQPMLGIQFLCGLVPGVAALLALERGDRKGDVVGCILLVLATWSFEVGLAFVAGSLVGIALRPDRWRRAWIVAVPLLAYLVWRAWASQYDGTGIELSNLIWVPAYAVDSLGDIVVSLFGRFFWVGSSQLTYLHLVGFDYDRLGEGLVLLALEALGVYLVVRAIRRRGPAPATLWIALATMLALWVEQGLALSPDRTPGEIRYVFQDVVVFLLVAVEAARGVRATRSAVAIALGLTAVAIVGNAARFKEGRDILAGYSPPAKAAIGVMNLGGAHVSPDFNPAANAPEAFVAQGGPQVGAATIQAISAKFGSPGYSVGQLLAQPEPVRRSADLVAARALDLKPIPASRPAPSSCARRQASGGGFALPAGGAVLVAERRSPLALRRFAGAYAIALGDLHAGRPTALRIPVDAANVLWRGRATGAGRIAVCPLPAGG